MEDIEFSEGTELLYTSKLGSTGRGRDIQRMMNKLALHVSGGGLLESFSAWYVLAFQNLPVIVYSWSILWPIIDPIKLVSNLWANGFLTLKVSKNCYPILVRLLKKPKKATHYNQSSREYATPSSGMAHPQ